MSDLACSYLLRDGKLSRLDRAGQFAGQVNSLINALVDDHVEIYDLVEGDVVFITNSEDDVVATYDVTMPPSELQVVKR